MQQPRNVNVKQEQGLRVLTKQKRLFETDEEVVCDLTGINPVWEVT
jgi:hypothetical protein